MIGEQGKRHYFLMRGFNTLMYDHTLHRGRKRLCRYCLQSFSTPEILKTHVNDFFKINSKQMNKAPKKGEWIKFRNYGTK